MKKTYTGEHTENGILYAVVATARWDDECKNGHKTFAITGEVYSKHGSRRDGSHKASTGATLYMESCGCCHEQIGKAIPALAPLIKWHLVSEDGPMHYVANTVYLAGNRDHNGLLEGETRQLRNGKTGLLCWKLEATAKLDQYIDSATCPTETATLRYVQWCTEGKGKERDLNAARSIAVWPEATDEELSADSATLTAALTARLPELMAFFRRDIESLGFDY